jgi:hypothetical protein
MITISKVVSLLAISVALTLSGSDVFAKSGGNPGQVKTSGTSAAPSGSSAGGNQVKTRGCTRSYHCVKPTQPPGATGGNDPRGPNRGPGNPTLVPK